MAKEDDIIEQLILSGALEVGAIDENGEILYNFTGKLKDISPMLYKEHLNHVNREIMHFWELGFLEISDFSDNNPVVRLTTRAFDDESIMKLNQEERISLNEIKRVLKVL